MPDTQITELAGRHYLISQLLAGGVEVAMPLRDRGIDLIAYLDRAGDGSDFLACPIQLKANESARFGLFRKYEHIPNLLLVYAWNVSSNSPILSALTYKEAHDLLEDNEHTETKTWIEQGEYSLIVSDRWRELLAPYRMRSEDWKSKMMRKSLARLACSIVTLAALTFSLGAQTHGTTADDLTYRNQTIHWPKEFDPATATIFSHNETLIEAPCAHVFAVMTDVLHWPDWLIFAREAHIDGPDQTVKQGTLVHFTMFGGPMDSSIAEFVPGSRLAWIPRGAAEAKGQHYHTWLFAPEAGGCRVVTEETGISSDDGKRVAAGDTTMHRAHDLWLASLKWASENDTKHLFQTK